MAECRLFGRPGMSIVIIPYSVPLDRKVRAAIEGSTVSNLTATGDGGQEGVVLDTHLLGRALAGASV